MLDLSYFEKASQMNWCMDYANHRVTFQLKILWITIYLDYENILKQKFNI